MLALTVLAAVLLIYSAIITYAIMKISEENSEKEKTQDFRLVSQSFLLDTLNKELKKYQKLKKELNKLDKALEE